jgi:hypothetical protein
VRIEFFITMAAMGRFYQFIMMDERINGTVIGRGKSKDKYYVSGYSKTPSCFHLKAQRFRVCILSLSSWVQSTGLVLISGHLYQHLIVYISQAHDKPSARAKAKH